MAQHLIVIFRGSEAVLLRNPYFCDFPGGGGSNPLPPSGSAHEDDVECAIELRGSSSLIQ